MTWVNVSKDSPHVREFGHYIIIIIIYSIIIQMMMIIVIVKIICIAPLKHCLQRALTDRQKQETHQDVTEQTVDSDTKMPRPRR